VWEDVGAEKLAQKRHQRRVTLGPTMAGGVSSGYNIGELAPAAAATYIEGGLLVGADSPFSLHVGVGNDARSRLGTSITGMARMDGWWARPPATASSPT